MITGRTEMPEHQPDEASRELGARLRRARRQRGWNLEEAATASEGRFKPSTLSSYERADRRLTVLTLQELARLYDVSVTALLPPPSTSPPTGVGHLAQRIERLADPDRRILVALVERMTPSPVSPGGPRRDLRAQ